MGRIGELIRGRPKESLKFITPNFVLCCFPVPKVPPQIQILLPISSGGVSEYDWRLNVQLIRYRGTNH